MNSEPYFWYYLQWVTIILQSHLVYYYPLTPCRNFSLYTLNKSVSPKDRDLELNWNCPSKWRQLFKAVTSDMQELVVCIRGLFVMSSPTYWRGFDSWQPLSLTHRLWAHTQRFASLVKGLGNFLAEGVPEVPICHQAVWGLHKSTWLKICPTMILFSMNVGLHMRVMEHERCLKHILFVLYAPAGFNMK